MFLEETVSMFIGNRIGDEGLMFEMPEEGGYLLIYL